MEKMLDNEIEFLSLRPNMKILDAGCGTGTVTRKLALKIPQGEAHGIDIDPLFIEQAKKLVLKEGTKNVRFEVGNIDNLRYDNFSFDLSYCRLVLMHVGNPVKTVTELKRVTRKDGIVAASDVDDGGLLIFPPAPKFLDLWSKYGQLARTWGQNRYIGRQLFSIFSEAGLGAITIHPNPVFATQQNPGLLKMLSNVGIQILQKRREDMISAGKITAKEFEEAIIEFQLAMKHPGAFLMQGGFLAIGNPIS